MLQPNDDDTPAAIPPTTPPAAPLAEPAPKPKRVRKPGKPKKKPPGVQRPKRSKGKHGRRGQSRPVALTEKQTRALDLRREGKTYQEIAIELGFNSRQYAFEFVTKILHEMVAEPAEAVRAVEVDRLDSILAANWAKRSEPRHAEVLLRTMERRAKLLGLDAPAQTQVAALMLGPGDVDFAKLSPEHLRQELVAAVRADPVALAMLLDEPTVPALPSGLDEEIEGDAEEVFP